MSLAEHSVKVDWNPYQVIAREGAGPIKEIVRGLLDDDDYLYIHSRRILSAIERDLISGNERVWTWLTETPPADISEMIVCLQCQAPGEVAALRSLIRMRELRKIGPVNYSRMASDKLFQGGATGILKARVTQSSLHVEGNLSRPPGNAAPIPFVSEPLVVEGRAAADRPGTPAALRFLSAAARFAGLAYIVCALLFHDSQLGASAFYLIPVSLALWFVVASDRRRADKRARSRASAARQQRFSCQRERSSSCASG